MNFKSITTLGLVAVALAVTSLAPAQANNNNNKALNQLAMQYYMQNQAAAGNAGIYNNPLLSGNASVYNSALANYGYAGGSTPWSAGAIPAYGVTGIIPVSNVYNTGCGGGYNNGGYNNALYSNIVSPQYNNLSQQIANLQARLATNNLNAFQVARLQSKIAKLQAQTNGLAASGYGSPYGQRASVWNSLRNSMRI
jgi:hypothetical protein